MRRSVDECLRLLDGKKKLDLFECARVDPKTPIEISIGVLAEYIKAGKLGGISLSECSADSIRRAAKVLKARGCLRDIILTARQGSQDQCCRGRVQLVVYGN